MLGVRVTRVLSLLVSRLPTFQVLNEFFHNVCELDLVFNFYKVSSHVKLRKRFTSATFI